MRMRSPICRRVLVAGVTSADDDVVRPNESELSSDRFWVSVVTDHEVPAHVELVELAHAVAFVLRSTAEHSPIVALEPTVHARDNCFQLESHCKSRFLCAV